MRRSSARVLLFVAVLTGIGAAVAEEVVVEVQSLVIRSGKGSMYPPVAEAKVQDRLIVIERQPDKWLRVRFADQEGFVRETALVARGSGGLSEAIKGASALSGNSADIGATAAARGVGEDTAVYAYSKGMSTAGLQTMIANRNRVAGERWISFTQEGNVGPAKQTARDQ